MLAITSQLQHSYRITCTTVKKKRAIHSDHSFQDINPASSKPTPCSMSRDGYIDSTDTACSSPRAPNSPSLLRAFPVSHLRRTKSQGEIRRSKCDGAQRSRRPLLPFFCSYYSHIRDCDHIRDNDSDTWVRPFDREVHRGRQRFHKRRHHGYASARTVLGGPRCGISRREGGARGTRG